MTDQVECIVIGAGVVGLAVAKAIAEKGHEVLVLEREGQVGTGTSSRNSEVIHAGIYYPPGSLKALLCLSGREMLYKYCRERRVPHARCGKLIVGGAASGPQLAKLKANAVACGIDDLRHIDRMELGELETEVAGQCALLSPSTGIIDSHALMLALQGDIEAAGGMVVLRAPVVALSIGSNGVTLEISGEQPITLLARVVINAAGLSAQEIANMVNGSNPADIPDLHLAIGHYYTYSGQSPFRHLIYPLPEDGGLGIHATLDLGGQIKFGPDVRWIKSVDYSFDDKGRQKFIDVIRSYYPALDPSRLQPGYTGIRPKLSGPRAPAADFQINSLGEKGEQLIQLFGIESPGLTSALAIGEMVAGLCRF